MYNALRLFEENFAKGSPAGERLREGVAYVRTLPWLGPLVTIFFPSRDDEVVEDNPDWETAMRYFEFERRKGKHIHTDYR